MKKLLSYIKNSAFLPICAGIAAIQPQLSAQIQELYFNDVTDNDSTYISDISNWYTDTSRTTPFTGTLDGNQNGNVSGSGEFAIKVAAFNTPTFNNLTYETEGASKDFDFLVLGNDTVLTINGDLTTNFSLGNDGTFSQRTAGLVLWAKSTLHVKGDWIISSNRAESSNYQAVKITTGGDDINGSVLVDGNIISKGPDNIIFSTVRGDFKVGGTIDLNGSQWNLASTTSANTYTREIGGLGKANGGNDRVRMNITNTSTEPSNAVVNLIFKNKSSYEATTAFSRAKTDNAKLNITMMAEDASKGRQVLRIDTTDLYWCNGVEMHDANINDVEVNSGRLDIGMYYGLKGNNLQIYSHSGKTSDAIFSATSLMSGNEIGRAQFDSMTFYNGTIVFDLGEVENDFIQINGGVTRLADDAKLVFDITLSAEDLKVYLDLLGEEMMQWDIMSFKTDDSNIVADDIILKTQSGVEGTLDFIADASSGMTTVKLELAMVPEPAAFAGLLGAAALLLAIRRRRK